MLRFNPEKIKIVKKESKAEKANDDKKEINKYDMPVSDTEIDNFAKETAEKIKQKANELGITKKKLAELTGLDLEGFKSEKLKSSKLNRGGLEFIRDSVNESMREFSKSKKLNVLFKESSSRFSKFIEKNRGKISIAELGLYLSAFGSPALKELTGSNAKLEIYGKEISLADLVKNPELLKKIQESTDKYLKIGAEKEAPSPKITEIYEKVKDSPNEKIKYENLSEKIDESGKFFKYAEFIKTGEKENLDDISEKLRKNGNDVILFGEYHGPESNAINAVKILENLQEKGNKKIGKMGLEFLKFNDPKDIELAEKFNNKKISVDDFYYKGYYRSDIRPLLQFAQNNNIPITGLEDEKNFGNPIDMERFAEMSHRVGEMSKEKKNNEIVVIFIGQRHTTESNFDLDNPVLSDYKKNRKDAVSKDYTIKEYLEKLKFKPAAINLDEWSEYASLSDEYFGSSYNKLDEKNKDAFGEYVMENWNNYKFEQKKVFAVSHGEGTNTYSIVNSSKAPDVPPSLNLFKTINDNYPQLEKIIHKKNIDSSYDYSQLSLEYNGEKIKIAQTDAETGKIKEIFLPQEDYNRSSAEKMKNINKFASEEKLRETLMTYNPRLHKKEQEIKEEKIT